MELKTLKDIEATSLDLGCDEDGASLSTRLRQEAIKWVKNCGCSLSEYFKHDCSRCSFIMYFFNLTEADLIELKGGIIDNE